MILSVILMTRLRNAGASVLTLKKKAALTSSTKCMNTGKHLTI
jgi:hypothetical protein